eukprot:TRINITY_DN22710_c0_g1_i3.p1 TRINITY_DN22710_c0_g1~~TRINITY_DN22710_c0_g1_i3.p1  ORF type:complete len:725 (+),score=174.66 TRINITY_DN22710_c0_g1_i3:148-2322(+)
MAGRQNIRNLLKQREIKGSRSARSLESKKHVTPEFIERLGLFKELEGHDGCVNCLEWNTTGEILASGSDDQTVILWQGETGAKLAQLATDHQGNIFSVKFIPHSGDSTIVTGSQDSRVCLVDVEKQRSVQHAALCVGRVKRLAVSQETPGIFWSASEDGTVMQWDTREKWTEATTSILIDLNVHCARAEVKCIAVNPVRDNILAIGANDQFIRLYDRRKLSLKKMGSRMERATSHRTIGPSGSAAAAAVDSTPTEAVKYLVPGHLAGLDTTRSSVRSFFKPLTTTYLNFSSAGTELVVNMGGDHVYYFDKDSIFGCVSEPNVMETLDVIQQHHQQQNQQPSTSTGGGAKSKRLLNGASSSLPPLSTEVEDIKVRANAEFERENYTQALKYYNLALVKEKHPILYGNRAAALMKRKFTGDTYAALRDCVTTLGLNPGHIKALLRLAKCLHELERYAEAKKCLEIFKSRYPDHAKSSVCTQLEKDILAAEKEKKEVQGEGRGEGNEDMDTSETNDDVEEIIHLAQSEFQDGSDHDLDMEAGGGGEGEEEGEGREEYRSNSSNTAAAGKREGGGARNGRSFSEQELVWRKGASDYTLRYVGACNTTTDIKEANFFGNDCQFIMSGSDDGKIFIWDRVSTNLVKVLSADSSTVNCVQGHPSLPVLASSGIENVIRLWHPRPEDGGQEKREIENLEKAVKDNQDRMSQDPFEYFVSNDRLRDDLQCRTS